MSHRCHLQLLLMCSCIYAACYTRADVSCTSSSVSTSNPLATRHVTSYTVAAGPQKADREVQAATAHVAQVWCSRRLCLTMMPVDILPQLPGIAAHP